MSRSVTLFAVCKEEVNGLDEGNADKHSYRRSILQVFASRNKAESFMGKQRVELNAHRYWHDDEENFPHIVVPASSVTSWKRLSGAHGIIRGYVAMVEGQNVQYTDCVRFSIVARRVNTLCDYRKAFACCPYDYRHETSYSGSLEFRGGRIADHVIRGAYSRFRKRYSALSIKSRDQHT